MSEFLYCGEAADGPLKGHHLEKDYLSFFNETGRYDFQDGQWWFKKYGLDVENLMYVFNNILAQTSLNLRFTGAQTQYPAREELQPDQYSWLYIPELHSLFPHTTLISHLRTWLQAKGAEMTDQYRIWIEDIAYGPGLGPSGNLWLKGKYYFD